MAISYVQGAVDSANDNPASVTLGATPTVGNLLIFTSWDRSAGNTPTEVSVPGNSFTLIYNHSWNKADTTERIGHCTWAKIVESGDTTGPYEFELDATGNTYGILTEHAPTAGSSFVALTGSEPQATAGTDANDDTTHTAGPTGSVSTDTNLLYGTICWKNRGATTPTATTYTSINMTHRQIANNTGTNDGGMGAGSVSDTSTGTKSTTVDTDDTTPLTRSSAGAIMVFAEETAGGGDPEAALVGGKLLDGGMLTAGGNLVGR